jgi:hypothetical protein
VEPVPEEVPQLFGSFPVESEQQKQGRDALKRIRDAVGDSELADSIDDVLAGKATLRDLMGHPDMAGILTRTAAVMRTELEQMSPEELARMKEATQQ